MPYINTAPDLTEGIVESIRYHQNNLGARYHSGYGTDRRTAGQLTTVGGATVEVTALVKFEKKVRYGQEDEHRVQVGASAKCYGWGCADPSSEESFGEALPLDANFYDTAATAEPHVQAAREWAQKHAEKCRAQDYGH
jgi:hypothetical protein